MLAEIAGKEAGYCRGKGGSMHIADPTIKVILGQMRSLVVEFLMSLVLG